MSAACRHCFREVEEEDSPPSYMSILMFGSKDLLRRKMEKIEKEVGVLYGISTWCEKCRRCSIISYSLHVYFCMQEKTPLQWKNRLDYYAHMCDLAERLSGKKGLGFTVSGMGGSMPIPGPP